MNKQLHNDGVTIHFTHSLPLSHLVWYWRTAAKLRDAAAESRQWAARFPDGSGIRESMIKDAVDAETRAALIHQILWAMRPAPRAPWRVVEYFDGVINLRRTAKHLRALLRHIERVGPDVIVQMRFAPNLKEIQ